MANTEFLKRVILKHIHGIFKSKLSLRLPKIEIKNGNRSALGCKAEGEQRAGW